MQENRRIAEVSVHELLAYGAGGVIPIALFNIAGQLMTLMGNISLGPERGLAWRHSDNSPAVGCCIRSSRWSFLRQNQNAVGAAAALSADRCNCRRSQLYLDVVDPG